MRTQAVLSVEINRPLATVFCSPQRRVLNQRRPFPPPSERTRDRRSLIGWLSADEKHIPARSLSEGVRRLPHRRPKAQDLRRELGPCIHCKIGEYASMKFPGTPVSVHRSTSSSSRRRSTTSISRISSYIRFRQALTSRPPSLVPPLRSSSWCAALNDASGSNSISWTDFDYKVEVPDRAIMS
jgi:hypothetical protein